MTVNVGAGGTVNQHPEIQLVGPAVGRRGSNPRPRDYEVAANGRTGPVRSDSSGFERKFGRWCRIGMWDETWDFLNGNRRVRVRFGDPRQQICYRPLAAGVNSTGSDPRPEATCDLASFRGSSRRVSPISLRAQVLQSIT